MPYASLGVQRTNDDGNDDYYYYNNGDDDDDDDDDVDVDHYCHGGPFGN